MKRDEKAEIKRDKAKAVKNSGRGIKKGDATLHRFLVDYKHNASSFTLTKEAWIKMRKDAWKSTYRYPCLSLVLGEDSDTKVAVIEKDVFYDMVNDDYPFEKFEFHVVTNNTTFSLTRKTWRKFLSDAWSDGNKYPCISLSLGAEHDINIAFIPWEIFRKMIYNSIYE